MMMPHASRGASARACARIAVVISRGSETLVGRSATLTGGALPPEDVAFERVFHLVKVSIAETGGEVLPTRVAGDEDNVAVWLRVAGDTKCNGECGAS
jgi:hypothetical protein